MSDGGAAATPQKVQLPIARVIEDVDADLAGGRSSLVHPARLVASCHCLPVGATPTGIAHVAGRPADERIQELNEHYQTYGMVEQQLIQRRARLSGKMPEIQKTLDALLMLQQRHRDEQEVLTLQSILIGRA
jgi:hypothetical protein